MKKIFLLLFLCICSNLSAQNFAPIGAKWYYTQGESGIPSSFFTSYTLVESVADTIIQSKSCSKLKVTFNHPSNQQYQTWYMYSDSQIIYYYSIDSSQFFLLYDFTKLSGDSFLIEGYNLRVYADSVSSININGNLRKEIFTHTNSLGADLSWISIEGIGNRIWMFPVLDNYITGPLRCYSDPSIGLYETGVSFSCDWNTSTEEINSKNFSFDISPNPSSGIFSLSFSKPTSIKSIEVYDVLGERIFHSENYLNSKLNLTSQSAGIYLLQLQTENGIENKILVINK